MPRYLAIDLGGKRTGLAVGDDETQICGPVGLVDSHNEQSLLKGIDRAIEELAPDEIIVGIPYNMDGTEGEAANRAIRIARRIAKHTSLPIHHVDERLTSHEAEDQLQGRDLTHKGKKQRRDALAAAAILRRFLLRKEADASDGG